MLAMNPQLMRLMSTPHLIAALDAEEALTPAQVELVCRLEQAEDELEELRAEAGPLAEENSRLNSKSREFDALVDSLRDELDCAETLEGLQERIESLLDRWEF